MQGPNQNNNNFVHRSPNLPMNGLPPHQNYSIVNRAPSSFINVQQNIPQIIHPSQLQQSINSGFPWINSQSRVVQEVHLPMNVPMPLIPRPNKLEVEQLKDYEEFMRCLDQFINKDQYFCQICQSLLWQPSSCDSCHKSFCLDCIYKWLLTKKTCPCCREQFKTCKTEALIVNSLGKLVFVCPNEQNGCQESVNYDAYLKHSNDCEFQIIECGNHGCSYRDLKQQAKNHPQTCPFQPLKCQWCNHSFKRFEFDQHAENCDEKILQCYNEGCMKKFRQADFFNHLEICDFKMVKCAQCSKEMCFKDIDQHLSSCDLNVVNCSGCKVELFLKEKLQHEEQCLEVLVSCLKCTMHIIRKDIPFHTQVLCLEYSQSNLLQKNLQLEEQVKHLQQEQEKSSAQVKDLRHMMGAMFQLIHQQQNCKCRSPDGSDCQMRKDFQNFKQSLNYF